MLFFRIILIAFIIEIKLKKILRIKIKQELQIDNLKEIYLKLNL